MQMNKEVVMVRLMDIIPNRFQPRLTFDEEALNDLANSIKEHGIIQPLILRDLGSKYEIIAGERRYKAATIAGLTEVPAIIGSMDDQTSAELALIENIQRKDLSAIEEAKSYKKILDLGNLTQETLAKRMGKSQSTIANKMRLLSLTNEVQVALMNNLISERHARCLLQVKDEDKQKEMLNKIITERMTVRDTDEYIKNNLEVSKTETVVDNGLITNQINSGPLTTENDELVTVKIPDVDHTINSTSSSVDTSKAEEIFNPNVYAQSENMDFININNLNSETQPAYDNISLTSNETFNGSSNTTVNPQSDPSPNPMTSLPLNDEQGSTDYLTKIKMATAIKLARDTAKEINDAGYIATTEEVDMPSEYQIIIKIQK